MESDSPARMELACRAVLFDLDGVLVDSHRVVERTWQRWLERTGLQIPGLVARAHGRRSIETVRDVAPQLDGEAEVRWLAEAELADLEGLDALPGAHDALSALPDSRRAIVTSAGRALATLRLDHLRLPIPEVLVAAEDVRTGKPAPECYRLAAARLDFDPADCVVVEDTPAGMEAGRAAGARVIGVATTFPASALVHAAAVVASLADVRIAISCSHVHLHPRPFLTE